MDRRPRRPVPRAWRRALVRTCGGLALAGTALAASAAVSPNIVAVQPDQLTAYWVMTNTSLNVDVPNAGVNLDKPTCSAVTYMIGADGVTRDIVVRKTIPAGDLATVAKSAVKDMHYAPGARNAERQPVFTYLIVPFNLPADPAARQRITDACKLEGFPRGYR
ncbi:MAG TPA: energy transducer TonB [Rhodanobacteraceae bacterium]|nr:energy transducer TonB [Rhodanobacteraceae bacterium]